MRLRLRLRLRLRIRNYLNLDLGLSLILDLSLCLSLCLSLILDLNLGLSLDLDLGQPLFIIGISELSHQPEFLVPAPDAYCRMRHTVESGGLDHCIMYHIPEDNPVTRLQFTMKSPVAHHITRQA